jgi:hypothetical protein
MGAPAAAPAIAALPPEVLQQLAAHTSLLQQNVSLLETLRVMVTNLQESVRTMQAATQSVATVTSLNTALGLLQAEEQLGGSRKDILDTAFSDVEDVMDAVNKAGKA